MYACNLWHFRSWFFVYQVALHFLGLYMNSSMVYSTYSSDVCSPGDFYIKTFCFFKLIKQVMNCFVSWRCAFNGNSGLHHSILCLLLRNHHYDGWVHNVTCSDTPCLHKLKFSGLLIISQQTSVLCFVLYEILHLKKRGPFLWWFCMTSSWSPVIFIYEEKLA